MTTPTPGAVKPRTVALANSGPMAAAKSPTASDADLQKLVAAAQQKGASALTIAAGQVALDRLAARAKTRGARAE